ncbi:hypothetical protein [Chondrinema litorale]|uniref:hypothetical protein n=1 Tax=Chondrinema litorale TaxID=2994555 RepID=UPI002542FA21|nr:hypothetical protein [Chondrinema litorale]UZR99923.1 hypothetical protein OQ292_38775 [Chondrinema litorale]
MPLSKKGDLVFPQGEYINSIPFGKYELLLYRVGYNFFEVLYNPTTQIVHDINIAEKERLHLFSKVKIEEIY